MPVWGRNAAAGLDGMQPKRHGRTSIILAFVALALVVSLAIYLGSLPSVLPKGTEDMALYALLGAYFVVAPTLHIIGFCYGIAGLLNPTSSRMASVIGILLNVALVLSGVGFGIMALSTVAAFT